MIYRFNMSLRESFIHLTHSRLTREIQILLITPNWVHYLSLPSNIMLSATLFMLIYRFHSHWCVLCTVCWACTDFRGEPDTIRSSRYSVLHTDEPHGDRAPSPSSACFIKNSQHRTESRQLFFSTWVCAFVISCTITSYSKSFQTHSINWFCSLFENALMHKPNKNFNTSH